MANFVDILFHLTELPMTQAVFVGLDQWVMTDAKESGGKVGLFTDGLSGCVAVVLIGKYRACLAHVYSKCDESNWEEYAHQLSLAFVWMKRGGQDVDRAALIASEPSLKGEKWRCEALQKLILKNCQKVKYIPIIQGTSVLVYYEEDMYGEAWEYEDTVSLKRNFVKRPYYNTVGGLKHFTVYGHLPNSYGDGHADI